MHLFVKRLKKTTHNQGCDSRNLFKCTVNEHFVIRESHPWLVIILIVTLFSANRDKKDDEKNKQNSAKGTAHYKTTHSPTANIANVKSH